MDVDAEIDQLISDSPPRKPAPLAGGDDDGETICRWNDCLKEFGTVKELGEHIIAEHIPEKKPFTCEWIDCPRKGHEQNSKFQLNTHVRSHTGEKPFECTRPGCGRAFVRNDALQKHLRQHDTADAENVPMPAPKKSKPKAKRKAETTQSSQTTPGPGTHPPSGDGAKPYLDSRRSSIAEYPLLAAATNLAHAGPSSHSMSSVHRHHVESAAPPLPFDWALARSAGLSEDMDLVDVIASIASSKPFWTCSQRDMDAVEAIRRVYPHKPNLSPDHEDEDEFDEGVSRRYPPTPEPMAAMTDDSGAEIRVLSRPRWQVKYVMAKAKLMLVEEENRMRREQLRDWMEREEAMNQGKELKDLGVAGKAFADVVREDVSRELALFKAREAGLNGHDEQPTSARPP